MEDQQFLFLIRHCVSTVHGVHSVVGFTVCFLLLHVPFNYHERSSNDTLHGKHIVSSCKDRAYRATVDKVTEEANQASGASSNSH